MYINGSSASLAAILRLQYQPVIRLGQDIPAYAEVLARTLGQDGNLDGPQIIVNAMDSVETALSLTCKIMDMAFSEYHSSGLGERQLPLAFNLPLNVLVHPVTLARIQALTLKHAVPPERVSFELTESPPVTDLTVTTASITAFHQAGYLLALDDITPETPFLTALMNTPLSAVKLDRSVVIDDSREMQNFIRFIADLAEQNLQMVVAEGIETHEQCDRMKRLGVNYGQGFLFSHPLDAQTLARKLGEPEAIAVG